MEFVFWIANYFTKKFIAKLLSTGNFEWLTQEVIGGLDVEAVSYDGEEGYILEVDLHDL